MEKLQIRSDGISEYQDGRCAVFMLRHSNLLENGDKTFSYMPSFVSEPINVQWSGDVGVFPFDVASGLVYRGYARYLTAEEVEIANNEDDIDDDGKTGGKPAGDVQGDKDKDQAGKKKDNTPPDEPVGGNAAPELGKNKK